MSQMPFKGSCLKSPLLSRSSFSFIYGRFSCYRGARWQATVNNLNLYTVSSIFL